MAHGGRAANDANEPAGFKNQLLYHKLCGAITLRLSRATNIAEMDQQHRRRTKMSTA